MGPPFRRVAQRCCRHQLYRAHHSRRESWRLWLWFRPTVTQASTREVGLTERSGDGIAFRRSRSDAAGTNVFFVRIEIQCLLIAFFLL